MIDRLKYGQQENTRRMQHLYMFLKFLIGGGIITGVTYLTRSVSPSYAGILAAAPITTTLAFVFTRYETTQVTTRELVLSSCAFAVPTLVFLFVLYVLMGRWTFTASFPQWRSYGSVPSSCSLHFARL